MTGSRRAARALLLPLAVVLLPSGTTHGIAAPSAATDGPIVVQADPFTAGAPGLLPGQIEMTTISTRPDLVTGGDARIAVRGLQADDLLVVTRDGTDVSAAFTRVASRPGQAPGAAEGVVTGLEPGVNHLTAVAKDKRFGRRQVNLTVVNHSLQGPIISGPHQEPYVCQQGDAMLGSSSGPDCLAPPKVIWRYADNTGQFHALADPYAPYPPDTASTTVNGKQVPFVVRVSGLVINRSVTQVAVLDDPHARGPNRPFAPVSWNHKLVYQFGQGCNAGYYQAWNPDAYLDVFGDATSSFGANSAGALIGLTQWLGGGGMVAQSSLTTFRVSCNQITSAETLMMVKEHVIDEYGDITHTIGAGSSGGAIQQYTNADGYPGLIDAGTPTLSFPDVWSLAMTSYACSTLERVFNADQTRWTPDKKVAVTGMASPQTCTDFATNPTVLDPRLCPAGIPQSRIYHPTTNPHGVRCTLQDSMKSILGIDPVTGFAYRPIDDTGVQYGLKAWQAGRISLDDFLVLNRDVGGLTLDFAFSPRRSAMPAAEASRVYRTGIITGRGALTETPIIDQSFPAFDYVPGLAIHEQARPFQLRARLDAHFGTHASRAIWTADPLPSNAIVVAESWLNNLDALQVSNPTWSRSRLVAASRPAEAADQCRAAITGVPTACDQGIARGSTSREVAGGPLSEDNIDCQLRPLRTVDYPGITPGQFQVLQSTFPRGVCDYTKPSVGMTARSQTWLSYGGDGSLHGEPLPVPYQLVRSAPAGRGGLLASAEAGGSEPSLPSTGRADVWSWLAFLALGVAVLLSRGPSRRTD